MRPSAWDDANVRDRPYLEHNKVVVRASAFWFVMDGTEVESMRRLYEAIRLADRVIAIRPGPFLNSTGVQVCTGLDRTWQPPAYWNPDVVSSAEAAAAADIVGQI